MLKMYLIISLSVICVATYVIKKIKKLNKLRNDLRSEIERAIILDSKLRGTAESQIAEKHEKIGRYIASSDLREVAGNSIPMNVISDNIINSIKLKKEKIKNLENEKENKNKILRDKVRTLTGWGVASARQNINNKTNMYTDNPLGYGRSRAEQMDPNYNSTKYEH